MRPGIAEHVFRRAVITGFMMFQTEVCDVIVEPKDDTAYTIFAQAQDRTGYARATLAPRMGMTAEVPPMDPRPVRTMQDMGMSMAGMKGMDMSGMRGWICPG